MFPSQIICRSGVFPSDDACKLSVSDSLMATTSIQAHVVLIRRTCGVELSWVWGFLQQCFWWAGEIAVYRVAITFDVDGGWLTLKLLL